MQSSHGISALRSFGLWATLLASPAAAVDGVIEINGQKALAGGVTSSDTAGYPVTIDAPGSYRLTSSLYTGSDRRTAIEITANGVSLDLNGFTIGCARPTLACLSIGSDGWGIAATDRADVVVRNGIIRDMGLHGVQVGTRGRVEKIQAISNGLAVASTGLSAGRDSLILNSSVTGSGSHGISVEDGSVVMGNAVSNNVGTGIWAETGCAVIGNTASGNAAVGIRAGAGGIVRDNSVTENGSTGLGLSSTTGYANNVINANGVTVSSGVQIGANLCDGSTTCP